MCARNPYGIVTNSAFQTNRAVSVKKEQYNTFSSSDSEMTKYLWLLSFDMSTFTSNAFPPLSSNDTRVFSPAMIF